MDLPVKIRRSVIFAVTFGNLLEWYEIYLYVYWSPIIAKLFFAPHAGESGLIFTFLIFGLALLARPIGGFFFGRLGDRIGRKKAFILSLLMMTVPTVITGLLPTREQVGILAPIFLTCTRFLQAFPAGGELPGAFCFLYESAQPQHRRYFCSWAFVGVLSGLLISTIECFFLELFLSEQDVITWGWRLSFLIGGLLGLCGLILRSRLHETPLYQEMAKHSTITKEPFSQVLRDNKKQLFLGALFWVFNSSSTFFITVNAAEYLKTALATSSYIATLIISSSIIILLAAPLPIFGFLADTINNKKMLIWTMISSILLLGPLSYFAAHLSIFPLAIAMAIFILLAACNSALLPYITSELFPTRTRYTCIGICFNTVDSVVGGFTPFLVLYLTRITKYEGAFSFVILFFGLISLLSYFWMKEKHPTNTRIH